MIRIGVCADESDQLKLLQRGIDAIMERFSRNTQLLCFSSGEDLLFEMEVTGVLDIVLLEVKRKGMESIETARSIRSKNARAIIIFISEYEQYYKEMIDVQPFAFLEKPIEMEKLEKVLSYALETRFDLRDSYCFYANRKHFRIPLMNIRYFQSDKRIIRMSAVSSTHTDVEYNFYGKLEDVERELKELSIRFIRLRKSFIVNPQFIMEFSMDRITLDNGMIIEITKNYKKEVREFYISMLRNKK